MRLAIEDLKPKRMYIATPMDSDYWLDENIQVEGVKLSLKQSFNVTTQKNNSDF